MFPIPNYKWKCKNCGEELIVHQDEEFPHLGVVSPKCPNCNGEMVGNLIVRRGPFPENPFRNDQFFRLLGGVSKTLLPSSKSILIRKKTIYKKSNTSDNTEYATQKFCIYYN